MDANSLEVEAMRHLPILNLQPRCYLQVLLELIYWPSLLLKTFGFQERPRGLTSIYFGK